MDKGILRFMAEAYLLLHSAGLAVESVTPQNKESKKKQRRQRRSGLTGNSNKEAKSGRPPEEG
jgi:hypothetical protein